jgi:chromosome segregation ATPase
MIGNLKTENKKLKNKLNQKEKDDLTIEYKNINNNVIKHNNNEKNLEKNIIDLKKEIIEIKNKLKEYEGTIEILKNKNKEQEMIIENKNKEILNLIIKIGNFEKSIQNNENIHEKLNKSNENYKNSNDNLKSEILKLNKTIEDKNDQIKELQIKLKFANNFDNRKQKILEILFNFYKKLKKVINYEQSKELLQDIIDIMTVDDFKIKVDKVEKRIIQIIEDIQIKYGHCFACDIACCTSHVDKLKKFRNIIPKKK